MKRKLTILLAVLLSAAMMGGCGKESGALKDMKVEKYLTLGEYMGLPVQLPSAAVDEAQVEELFRALYLDSVTPEMGILDREVVQGDTVNIDYEGKKDGVAFAGGTASGAQLEIGSGSFIAGFEDGLVGAAPGETRDLDLRFPEGYGNAELAGQAVVFTVTVNYIYPTDYKDEVVAALGIADITTVEGLRQFVRDYLKTNAQNTYRAKLESTVVDNLIAGCVFQEIPETVLQRYRNNIQEGMEADCAAQGVDINTYCMYSYGMDAETFLDQYAQEAAKQSLAFQAVANAEDLNVTDEELQENLEQYANQGGYATVEEFLGEMDREEYREYFMFEKVLDFLTQNARITEY
ncbi:MAG: trigger factor [Acetatifactor sp.]